MALYRNIAGVTPQSEQVGVVWADLFGEKQAEALDRIFNRDSDTIQPYLPAETNSPEPVTTGGPYIIRDFTDPPYPTVNIDTSPGATDALPTEVPPTQNGEQPATATPGSLQQNILPLLTLAGLALVAIKGPDLLPKRNKLVFVAGLGALYYGMAKGQTT